jgi:hypothetical protein
VNPQQAPFPAGWWSFDLPGARGCDGTYCLSSYAALPPLEAALQGDFRWLGALEENLEDAMSVHRRPEAQTRVEANLDRLLVHAGQLGLKLPAPFVRFMGSPALQQRVPSCTACYFDLPERIVQSPAGDGGYLIRFLNDQQDVLFWFLYLNPKGEHCVVASWIKFDDEPLPAEVVAVAKRDTFFCGPSFEEFLYRFWLENEIWFAADSGPDQMTDEQRRYVEHYRRRSAAEANPR